MASKRKSVGIFADAKYHVNSISVWRDPSALRERTDGPREDANAINSCRGLYPESCFSYTPKNKKNARAAGGAK